MDIRRVETGITNYVPSSPKRVQSQQEQTPQTAGDQVSIGGNQQDSQAAAPKKWTIMHYTAADNNLTSFMVADVNEMERVGSTKNMNIIAQVDQGKDNCKRYFITKDNDMSKLNSPVIKDLGRTNMADPEVMGAFIRETMEKYPAEHYAFIISDHGGGWKGAVEDDSHHGWMTMPMVREGIEKGLEGSGRDKLDLVGFDACLMAGTEIGYELKDVADFMVASQESEGGAGWAYTPLLTKEKLEAFENKMRQRLDVSPKEFSEKIVTMAKANQGDLPTMSAMDLSKMDNLAAATDKMGQAILDTDTPNATLKTIGRQTQSFSGFKDQYHFSELIDKSPSISDQNLKDAAKGVMEAVKDTIIAEQHSSRYPNAHGTHIEIPSWGGVDSSYQDLKFAKDTKWDEAMNKMSREG